MHSGLQCGTVSLGCMLLCHGYVMPSNVQWLQSCLWPYIMYNIVLRLKQTFNYSSSFCKRCLIWDPSQFWELCSLLLFYLNKLSCFSCSCCLWFLFFKIPRQSPQPQTEHTRINGDRLRETQQDLSVQVFDGSLVTAFLPSGKGQDLSRMRVLTSSRYPTVIQKES
jgi:hypothetical protein